MQYVDSYYNVSKRNRNFEPLSIPGVGKPWHACQTWHTDNLFLARELDSLLFIRFPFYSFYSFMYINFLKYFYFLPFTDCEECQTHQQRNDAIQTKKILENLKNAELKKISYENKALCIFCPETIVCRTLILIRDTLKMFLKT